MSSFPEMNCGIAQYTYQLVKHLSKNIFVRVYTHKESNPKKLKNVEVVKAFDRNDFFSYIKLKNLLKEEKIVHVQHEHGLYGKFGGPFNGLFGIYLLRKLRKAIVTLHTVFTPSYILGYYDFLKRYNPIVGKTILRNFVSAGIYLREFLVFPKKHVYIVHSYEQKKVLNERGIKNVYVIRHGVPVIKRLRKRKRKELTLLCFGFVDYRKNYELVIKAMKFLDAKLIIAGKANESYLRLLKRLAVEHGVQDRVVFINKFLSEREKTRVFENSDILVYPVLSMSQSGVVSDAISFRIPVIVGAFPYVKELFQEFGSLGYLIKSNSEREIVKGINFITNNYRKIRKNLERAYREINWERIAKKHLEIYEVFV